jgi:large subunit ribosomal protein L17
MARRVVRDRGAVLKLFDELAPRFLGRQGGYTRIIKLPQRPGDAAPMSMLELLPEDGGAPKAPEKDEKGKGAKAEAKGEKAPAKKAEAKGEKAPAKKAAKK